MTTKTTTTKTQKVVNALEKGKTLTAAQITNTYGIQNPSALIHQLRGEGLPIETVTKKSGVSAYQMYA
jgi:enoyl reductase-like protein